MITLRQVAFGMPFFLSWTNKIKEYAIDSKYIKWHVFNAGDYIPSRKGLSTNRRRPATARKLATIFFCVACSQKPIFADAGHANCMCTPAGTCKAHTKTHNYFIKVVFKWNMRSAHIIFLGVWYIASVGYALISGCNLVTFRWHQ